MSDMVGNIPAGLRNIYVADDTSPVGGGAGRCEGVYGCEEMRRIQSASKIQNVRDRSGNVSGDGLPAPAHVV